MNSISLRALLLGSVLGCFTAAVGASCGNNPSTCNPSVCSGCCDAHGVCQPGSTAQWCGAGGAECQSCGAGQQCSLGICVGGSGGGTAGSGGGTAGTGGGTAGTGGGTAGTGGGTAGTGGGTGGGSPPTSPAIETDRTHLAFGAEFGRGTWVGTRVPETLQVRNGGVNPLIITQVALSGSPAYTVDVTPGLDAGSISLQGSQRAFLIVRFNPPDAGTYPGALTIHSNASNDPALVIPLSATGVTP